MTWTQVLIIAGAGFVVGWVGAMLCVYRITCERMDNSNKAIKAALDVKVQASKQRVQFEHSDN